MGRTIHFSGGCALRLTALGVITSVLLAYSALAGSIFDDDWVPPPPRKVESPAKDAAPSPAQTPEKSRTNPEKPAPAQPAQRRAVPDKAAQAKSRKLFKEVFQKELADRSPAGRRKLATQLMQEADKTASVPSDQFVLLVGAQDAAREGSDLTQCVAASDALASKYDVDALELKLDSALKTTLRADVKAITAHNVFTGVQVVNELEMNDDYTSAQRLLKVLRPASTADKFLAALVDRMSRDVDAKRAFVDRLPAQIAKLRTTPADPAANLAYGEYLAMIKHNWDGGIPFLAKGSDPLIKAAAVLETNKPSDGGTQIEVADAWWVVAEKNTLWVQYSTRQHAVDWYASALKDESVGGLARKHAEQRVAEFGPAPGSEGLMRVSCSAGDTQVDGLEEGARYFIDTNAAIRNVPVELRGLSFMRRKYKDPCDTKVDCPAGSTIYVLLGDGTGAANARKLAEGSGWAKIGEARLDGQGNLGHVFVYRQVLTEAKHFHFPEAGWDGAVFVAERIEVPPVGGK